MVRRRILARLSAEESTFLGGLFRSETVGGAVALGAAALALVWANAAGDSYLAVRELRIGPLDLEHWAADGALTLFFLVAGLELARELTVGSLSRAEDAVVPVVAAACGVAVPALLFLLVNRLSSSGTDNLGGWAIPAATDIAFALAVLAVAGPGLPTQLRAFLLTLAVVDDLIVIAIIAVFYTADVHLLALAGSLLLIATYAVTQRLRLHHPLLLVVLGIAAWWLLLESGVHATIAGAALGLLTRVRRDPGEEQSPGERLEHHLSPWSAGLAVPLFALMSAGVVLDRSALESLATSPVAIGVALGLVVGKPLGVLGGTWLLTRLTRAELSEGVTWRDLAGVGVLTGIGFTVALLVSGLAFDDHRAEEAKAAVLLASLVSAALGTAVLRARGRRSRTG